MGGGTLLQNHYGVLNMALHEINQQSGVDSFLPYTSIDW